MNFRCNPKFYHSLLNDDFRSRMGDFGVAKVVDSNEPITTIAGSLGYTALGSFFFSLLKSIFLRL